MKARGFTLIELLAVIVILSLIALISTPIILNIIENARKQAFLDTGYGILEAGRYRYSTKGDTLGTVYDLINNNIIPYQKGTLKTGQLKYDNRGKIALTIWDGNYCVVKNYDSEELMIVENKDGVNCNIEKIDKIINGGATGYLCSNPGSVVATEEMYFTFNQTTKTITGYSNSGPKDVVIPCTIGGVNVENIGSSAFEAKQLTSVLMPDTVKKIGDRSFWGNLITTLELGNSVTEIEAGAFYNNRLTEIVFPDSLKKIYDDWGNWSSGGGTFSSNRLTSVTFGSGIEYIGEYAFYGSGTTNKIANIDFSRSTNLNIIKNNAFSNNVLTELSLNNCTKLANIESYAFYGNRMVNLVVNGENLNIGAQSFQNNLLENLTLNGKIISIAADAFKNNQLPADKAYIKGRNADGTINNVLVSYGGASRSSIILPDDITGVTATFSSLGITGTFNSGNGLTNISSGMFDSNSLTSVVIGNSVTRIGDRAFWGNLITTLQLGNSVTEIEAGAFYNNRLTEVVFPDSLKKIHDDWGNWSSGGGTFSSNRLTSVTFGSGIEYIGEYAFYGSGTTNKIANIDFSRSTNLNIIKNNAFSNNMIVRLEIPSSVKIIESSAFYGNTTLTEIFIKGKVDSSNFTSLGTNWNGACSNIIYELTSCYVYSGNTITNYNAVCSKDIEIPSLLGGNTITTIAANAFKNKGITKAVIPSTVTTVGDNAFSENTIVPIIVMGKTNSSNFSLLGTDWNGSNNIVYENDQNTCFAMSGSSITNFYDVNVCQKNITLPSGATSIANNVFANKGITSVNLNNVVSIGDNAFKDNKLSTITIPNSVTTIGSNTFTGNLLSSITVLDGTRFSSLGTAWNGNVLKVDFQGDSLVNNCYDVTGNAITKYQAYCPVTVVIPTSIEGTNITSIGANAFKNSAVRTITIGSHIQSIGDNAFENNDIVTLTLNEGLQTIGANSFKNTGLLTLNLPGTVMTIGNYAFVNNANLGVINIIGKNNASDFTSLGTNWNGTCNNINYLGN